jgi:hypothetical protein
LGAEGKVQKKDWGIRIGKPAEEVWVELVNKVQLYGGSKR